PSRRPLPDAARGSGCDHGARAMGVIPVRSSHNLIGLTVKLDRPVDRERLCIIEAARAPHAGELVFAVGTPITERPPAQIRTCSQSAKILRFRLALASKPYDVFFLCRVPTRNLDNGFNSTNLAGCEQAKRLWTQVTSRKEESVESYKVDKAKDPDAFPEPKWPTQSLDGLIGSTFDGRMITSE